jgi:hypothetical protein
MSATSLKAVLRAASIACALFGVFLLIYVGRVIAGVSDDRFEAIHPLIAVYGGYLIYQAFVFRRRYSSGFIHGFVAAIMCPAGFLIMAAIAHSDVMPALLRAGFALLAFLILGVIYKLILRYLGKRLFGKEIVE